MGEFVNAECFEGLFWQLYARGTEFDVAGAGKVHCRVVPQCLYNDALTVWYVYAFRHFLQHLWYDNLGSLVNDIPHFLEYGFLYVYVIEVSAVGEHDVAITAVETGVW